MTCGYSAWLQVYRQYTYIVGKYRIYLHELQKQGEKRVSCKFFCPVSWRVQVNFIFSDNVLIMCLSCNVKKSKNNWQFVENSRNCYRFIPPPPPPPHQHHTHTHTHTHQRNHVPWELYLGQCPYITKTVSRQCNLSAQI